MTTYAIRHPDRGKAHRRQVWGGWGVPPTGCGLWPDRTWLRVPLADVPPEELCKRCWPEVVR